jgi:hypothetical protein
MFKRWLDLGAVQDWTVERDFPHFVRERLVRNHIVLYFHEKAHR